MPGREVFNQYAERYDSWFERHPGLYAAELQAPRALLPESKRGIEVGVGSGRFARPLGVCYGIDPAFPLLELARARGSRAVCARAEALPFRGVCFDLVSLMQKAGFHEFEYRQTLKPGAALTDRAEPVEDGYGQGLFVVIKARKSCG